MLFIGTIVPFKVFSADLNNPEIQKLIAEKQQKIAALEECGKKVKGFKIAGISTIGLTTVGTIGNIALSNKREDVSNQLQTANQTLAAQQAAERAAAEEARKKTECEKNPDKEWTNEGCKDRVTLDASKAGVGRLSKVIDNGEVYNSLTYDNCSVNNNGDWCVQFDEYVVNGTSTCVSDYSNEEYNQEASNQSLSAVQSSGQYCYCKMTSWTPNDGSQNDVSSSWVFQLDNSKDVLCAHNCAIDCANQVRVNSDFRRTMFGSVAN